MNNTSKNILKITNKNWSFKSFICFPIIFFVILIDNYSKMLAYTKLKLNEPKEFMHNFLNFELETNKGSAYGTGASHMILTILIAVCITIFCIITFIYTVNRTQLVFIAMIIGGSLGNLINRIWNNGPVIDFIGFEFFNSSPYFIFNLADFFICCGITFMFTYILIFEIIMDLINRNRNINEDNK